MSNEAMITREQVLELDRNDPLKAFKQEFLVTDSDLCYLDGNSLGRLPIKTIEATKDFLTREWAHELVDGWNHWIDQAQPAGDLLARAALGAGPGQTLVCDTTSVNLFQLCSAVMSSMPERNRVIVDSANFPTDRYVVAGLAEQMGKEVITLDTDGSGGPGAVAIESQHEVISLSELRKHLSTDVSLLTLQAVNYRSGAKQDIHGINALAKEFGILVVWDCSHAIGSVDLDFKNNNVELAVGCTYKYGNSGPGSPAWLFVAHHLQAKLRVPIQGWFAQEKQFEMGPFFEPTDDIRRYQIASPSIIGIRAVEIAFEMIERAGIKNIEAKAQVGTALMVDLYSSWLKPLGFGLGSPEAATERGGHIILTHPDAKQIAAALRKLKKVIPDYREPNTLRLAVSPLATSYLEVFEGFERLRDLVQSGDYRSFVNDGNRVT